MTRDTLLPPEQLARVVQALYEDAERLGWETLPLRDRSRTYSGWVDDKRVGGILTGYMTPEAARAWIKDGPMKEYARARRGAGRYARFGKLAGTTAADVARVVLGDSARVVPSSEGIKPFHCRAQASDNKKIVFIAWGEARNYRNVLWAALRAAVTDGYEAHIVVMEPPGHNTTVKEAQLHEALARRCQITAHHMRERIMPGGSS